jgi:hypothetical protein
LLPTRSRGPTCLSVEPQAAFPIDAMSAASGADKDGVPEPGVGSKRMLSHPARLLTVASPNPIYAYSCS